MKNLIIFDYDGTLVDSLEIFRKHLVNACAAIDIKISSEGFIDLFNTNMFEGLLRHGIGPEKIPKVLECLNEGLSHDSKDIDLFSGIEDVIKRLAQKNRMAVITSNLTTIVDEYLRSRKLEYFSDILGADKETSKIQKIASVKSKYPGYYPYYIGDTAGDIVEGKMSGATTIAAAWGWHDKKRLVRAKPDYIVSHPRELIEIFNTPSKT